MKKYYFIINFFICVSLKASVTDTIDNWQLLVNGKPLVFGNSSSGISGQNSITISASDKIEITYYHCTRAKLLKTITVKDQSGNALFKAKNDVDGLKEEVSIETKKIVEYINSKKYITGMLNFYYSEVNFLTHGIPTEEIILFTVEFKVK